MGLQKQTIRTGCDTGSHAEEKDALRIRMERLGELGLAFFVLFSCNPTQRIIVIYLELETLFAADYRHNAVIAFPDLIHTLSSGWF